MSDLRRAAEMALEALEELRFANAPFLDKAMEALRTALAQTEQECVYPKCETAGGCDGPCGEKPVDTVNTSQERETVKSGHEPVAKYMGKTYRCPVVNLYQDIPVETLLYTAPPKREWVGLTDDEIYYYADKFLYQHGSNYGIKSFGKAIEAKLKEKNCG